MIYDDANKVLYVDGGPVPRAGVPASMLNDYNKHVNQAHHVRDIKSFLHFYGLDAVDPLRPMV
jgi:hypothetical protein